MWDSRTTHCNHPAKKGKLIKGASPCLKRLVGYICMTPTSFAKNLDELLVKRINAFQNGITTTHWPHEYRASSSLHSSPTYKLAKLSEEQKKILLGNKSTIDPYVKVTDNTPKTEVSDRYAS